MMTELSKKVFHGTVSDTPVSKAKKVNKPSIPDNVIDIPDWVRKKNRLSTEYAQRQQQLYAQANKPKHFRLRLQEGIRKFFMLFFE